MATRVYVGHLPCDVRERDLEEFFYKYGQLRDILIKNGFAFVEFDDPRDAEDAVHEMNNKMIRGQRVVVELTKRAPKGRDANRTSGTRYLADRYGHGDMRSFGSARGYYDGRDYYDGSPRRRTDYYPTQTRWRVIVENLSSRMSWQDLKDFMRAAGEVCYSDAHRVHKNQGVVCFSSESDMRRALDTLNGKELHGRCIKLIDGSRRTRSRSRSNSDSRSSSRTRSRSRSRSRAGSRQSRNRSRANGRRISKSRSRSGTRSPHLHSTSTRASPMENRKHGIKRPHSQSRSPTRSRSRSATVSPEPHCKVAKKDGEKKDVE